MKTGSTVMYILRLALTLLVITGVMAALLAGVNTITKPIIAAATEAKTQAAIEAVLPGGGNPIEFTDNTGIVANVYASDTGYAVEVTPSGFDGAITMMVGIDLEGKVIGLEIIDHTETPGLGAEAEDPAFREQFVGAAGSVKVSKDDPGSTIDAMSGATVTSRAICDGVNAALACVANMG